MIEQIYILGKFAYIKLYDDFGLISKSQYVALKYNDKEYEFRRLFWRIYIEE